MNNNHKTDEMAQENTLICKQKQKRKRKFRIQETVDSLTQLKEGCNDVTIDKSLSRDDSNENVKIPKKLSKRQLKKQKALQVIIQKKESSRINIMQKALSYVHRWKHSKNEWKFEKLKQIWLINNLLDENSISETFFPIVLEYFKDCRGKALEILLQKAVEIIKKAEKEEDEEHKCKIMKSIAYKRARQLLQTLPTDK
ncbi:hypothetical protein P5V15_009918 [Pogonomyrmex californicus]